MAEPAPTQDPEPPTRGASFWKMMLGIVADGALVRVLEGHDGPITRIAITPDGSLLASASTDRTVRIWQLADGALLRTFQGHEAGVSDVAFSPDGQTLASVVSQRNGMRMHWGTVRLWRVADGALVSTFDDDVALGQVASPSPSPGPGR